MLRKTSCRIQTSAPGPSYRRKRTFWIRGSFKLPALSSHIVQALIQRWHVASKLETVEGVRRRGAS